MVSMPSFHRDYGGKSGSERFLDRRLAELRRKRQWHIDRAGTIGSWRRADEISDEIAKVEAQKDALKRK